MNLKRMKIDDFLFQCSLRIKNSMNDATVLAKVSELGYNLERMLEGDSLLTEARLLTETFNKEYGDVDEAFEKRNAEHKKAHTTYMQMLSLAQMVFKNDANATVTLQLTGRRATTLSKWITQTSNFYNNLLKQPQWIEAMGKFNITKKKLEAARQEVVDVDEYAQAVMNEKGDAQEATVKRDAKFEELGDWVNEYESIARIALHEQPQLLEKLGIVVK